MPFRAFLAAVLGLSFLMPATAPAAAQPPAGTRALQLAQAEPKAEEDKESEKKSRRPDRGDPKRKDTDRSEAKKDDGRDAAREAAKAAKDAADKAARDAATQAAKEAEKRREQRAREDADKAKQEAAKQEAAKKQRERDAAEKAAREAEAKARAEKARAEEEAKAKLEATRKQRDRDDAEKSAREAEAKSRAEKAAREAEAKSRAEKSRAEEEAKAKLEAAKKQRDQRGRDAAEKSARDADAKARAEKAQAEDEAKAKAEREAKARAEQEEKAKAEKAAQDEKAAQERTKQTSPRQQTDPRQQTEDRDRDRDRRRERVRRGDDDDRASDLVREREKEKTSAQELSRTEIRSDRPTTIDGGSRTLRREGDRVVIRSNDLDRLRHGRDRRGDQRIERLPDGQTRTIVIYPDGTQIITVTDRRGEVIYRSRRERGGREIVLIREVRRPPVAQINLGPLRLTIPREQYIVDSRRASRRDLYAALAAPPVERVERVYSLEEVRQFDRIRDKMRRIDITSITFDTDSALITPDQAGALEELADIILDLIDRNPGELFLIEGHTDLVGSFVYNLALSERRAEAVAIALTEYFDVPAENLVTQGYGEAYPKIPTEFAERENRRVAVRRITPLVAGK